MTESPHNSSDSVTVEDILTEVREVCLDRKKKSAAEREQALKARCQDLANLITDKQ